MNRFLFLLAGVIFLFTSCKKPYYQKLTHNPELYRATVKKLNDIVLENNFPPVIASRNYVYANIAAYEVIAAGDPQHYRSLAGQIKHLLKAPQPEKGKVIDFQFASLLSFCFVGNAVTFPEGSMSIYVDELKQMVKDAGMPSDVFENSVAYSDSVAKHIMQWSKKDNYAQTRSASKYTVTRKDGRWIPTPPMYAQALEPHWGEIRTMVLDSASQISSPEPPAYNMTDKSGVFYKNVMEVKILGDSLTADQKNMADFWDDNAFKLNVIGHASFATKKFGPAGHWMNIAAIGSKMKNADFGTTAAAYTEASIALFDAFINCWYVKYTSNSVRPETVITKMIEPDWRPYIQTPPFPEYISGHAVISAAAAEVLTHAFGDNKAYTDASESEFGIPARTFTSFRAAAQEAGLSRVYGGIHYKMACVAGNMSGRKIGRLVVEKLHLKIR
ncbi:vanadium-dependent haloperoxidase [Mucilaginibacter sp. RB4R14]|uniref:vanadium-dependent haloperoxidase n=1 Tax=Mucilaginibacter aurantiaciroseus TaxID=2949308 RepID=UPI0020906D02|nr:vanadium-dependent haloperoxidase [Mucilaginibacter aurantiaciroseus]MCO5934357.1 vanadium-dependent haloperoxidase [Mucilaginibacter aurantiaciroseus]